MSLSQDGINSSQLGFRGVEDLGGGLKAGFNLLAGVNADTGTHERQVLQPSFDRQPVQQRSVKFASAATTRRRSGT